MNKKERSMLQGLAMTRCLGDYFFKKPTALAVAEPDVTVHKISDKDLFMVLVTDGVCDVFPTKR